MSIGELITVIAPNTDVRIRIVDYGTITGTTGIRKTQKLLDELNRAKVSDYYVNAIYPLYRARELYIETIPC